MKCELWSHFTPGVISTTELDPSNDYIKLEQTFDFIKFTGICWNNYMCFISSATSYELETNQSETGLIFVIIQLNGSSGWTQLGEEGVTTVGTLFTQNANLSRC